MPVYNERYLVATSIERVLKVKSELISRLDLIVVDDGSTDGTREVLRRVAEQHPERITYLELERNQGKGAAVRAGIAHARGAVTVIQDADLEYNPQDFHQLMVPFLEAQADAVFGSRFMAGSYRRAMFFRHSLGNRLLTTLSNFISDLYLSDMETCYKAVRTELLRSIPLRSNDFRMEPELTLKLAKRGARIFEVPISYAGRTYEEGKKIGLKDAFLALGAMSKYWLIDDVYQEDEYGSHMLQALAEAPNFNRWMGDVIRPLLGGRILEIGAGLGNLTRTLLPADRYTASDVNPHYLNYLRAFSAQKPYLDVARVDLANAKDFEPLEGAYDTVVCLNVLEHLEDEDLALQNIASALCPGGRAILLVPQHPTLFGSLDEVAGHKRRYTRETFRAAFERNGFEVEQLFDFNRTTVPGWWVNGSLFKRRSFGRVQLKLFNSAANVLRHVDRALPWPGISLIAVARKPVELSAQGHPVSKAQKAG